MRDVSQQRVAIFATALKEAAVSVGYIPTRQEVENIARFLTATEERKGSLLTAEEVTPLVTQAYSRLRSRRDSTPKN